MRDNADYRAANTRAQAAILPPPPRLAFRPWRRFSGRFATGRAKSCPRPYLRPPQLHGHPLHWYPFQWYRFQWYGYHSYGMHSQWNGLVCNALLSIPFHTMDSNRLLSAEGNGLGKTTNESGGAFTTTPDNSGNATNHLAVRTMLSCVAGGAQLEPPVHAPHTVYVKTLYRHRRPELLSPPHHQGRGRAGGGQAPGVIPVMSSTAIPVVS